MLAVEAGGRYSVGESWVHKGVFDDLSYLRTASQYDLWWLQIVNDL